MVGGGGRAGARRACGGLGALLLVLSACVGGDSQPLLVAHCLDARVDPPTSVACTLSEDGTVRSVSEVGLAPGVPFAVDRSGGHVVGVAEDGSLAEVLGDLGQPPLAESESAYAFDRDGGLVALDATGVLRDSVGAVIVSFAIDGSVDLISGIDISENAVAFGVQRQDGTFAVLLGDSTSGEVVEAITSDSFVGQPRWSPDGSLLAIAGPAYGSIEVLDRSGVPTASIVPTDPALSGIVTAPAWLNDDEVVFVDAVPALVYADANTGTVESVHTFDSASQLFPALPVVID